MKRLPQFSADLSAAFPLFLLLFGGSAAEIAFFLLAVILHEAGHLFCMYGFGYRAERIHFSLMGANILTKNKLIPYKKEILIYLSGPLFNLFGCAISLVLIRWDFEKEFLFFFFANFLLALFNLLPLPSLDGERALFSFFCLIWDEHTAFSIRSILCSIFLTLFCIFSILLFLEEKNPSLLVLAFFLILGERKSLPQRQ